MQKGNPMEHVLFEKCQFLYISLIIHDLETIFFKIAAHRHNKGRCQRATPTDKYFLRKSGEDATDGRTDEA